MIVVKRARDLKVGDRVPSGHDRDVARYTVEMDAVVDRRHPNRVAITVQHRDKTLEVVELPASAEIEVLA